MIEARIKFTINNYTSRIKRVRGGFLFELTFVILAFIFFTGLIQKWFFITASTPTGANWTKMNVETGEYDRVGNINVLILGVDSVDGTHRSDTVFVLGINPAKARVSMVSIPRDTRVIINRKARKINEILPRHGQAVLCSLLEDLLDIRISRYLEVNFQGFIKVVDTIGGIDLDIKKPMHYDDNWGNLHIHFEPGINHLDGLQALNYVRYRGGPTADLGRIKRQQRFMKIIIEKAMTSSVFVKLPQIVSQVFDHIKTDFSLAEIYTILKGFTTYNIQFRHASMPGEARYIDKISYFLPYQDKATEIGINYFSDFAAIELVASFSSQTGNITKNGKK